MIALALWIERLIVPSILIICIVVTVWMAPREDKRKIDHKTIGSDD